MTDGHKVADAIRSVFVSPNEWDRNMEAANVVDGLFAIARAIDGLAKAVKLASEQDQQPDQPESTD